MLIFFCSVSRYLQMAWSRRCEHIPVNLHCGKKRWEVWSWLLIAKCIILMWNSIAWVPNELIENKFWLPAIICHGKLLCYSFKLSLLQNFKNFTHDLDITEKMLLLTGMLSFIFLQCRNTLSVDAVDVSFKVFVIL